MQYGKKKGGSNRTECLSSSRKVGHTKVHVTAYQIQLGRLLLSEPCHKSPRGVIRAERVAA